MNIKEEHMNRMRQAIVKALQDAKSQPLRYLMTQGNDT